MAGKRGSRRHCTTSFSENVVVAGTSYQTSDVLAFCNRERAHPPSITITVLTFLVKNSGCLFFDITRKNFKSNLVLVFVLVKESKDLSTSFPGFSPTAPWSERGWVGENPGNEVEDLYSPFLYICLPSRLDYDVKIPNLTF